MKREWWRVWHRVGLAQLVPIGLGLLLIGAATSKAMFLRAGASVGADSLFRSPLILASVVSIELVMGIWFLILGRFYRRLTRALGVGFFGVLGCFSGYAFLTGQPCNCFGMLQVPAAAVFGIDLAAVTLLLLLPLDRYPDICPYFGVRWRLSLFSTTIFFCALPVSIWAGSYAPSRLSDLGIVVGDSRLVVLQPAEWVGKRFPLQPYTNLPSSAMQGDWLVVLHRRDCPHCQDVVPQVLHCASSSCHSPSTGLALIDLLPGGATGTRVSGDRQVIRASLTDDWDWFAHVPVALYLDNGLVAGICDDERHIVGFAASILGSRNDYPSTGFRPNMQ